MHTIDISPNLRRIRAEQLTAYVMHIVGDYLADDGRNSRRACAQALRDTFYESGVEIVTDEERAKAGLAPRNENGLTPQELHAIEWRRLEALSRPVVTLLPVKD